MKQTTKKLAGLACGLALVLGCGAGTLTASATSVGDVIAHAYAVGLPESDIQACIAQYSGREYTSEQCDQAIAALDNWAKERDDKINEEINKGTTTAAPEENRTTKTESFERKFYLTLTTDLVHELMVACNKFSSNVMLKFFVSPGINVK